MIKTGLYFGTFNPIHIGHLAIANYMVEFTEIEELWFIISPRNPFKEEQLCADEAERLDMVKMSIEGDARFRASDVEFNLPRPSFTITTLTRLNKNYPDHEFFLIMGSDNLQSLSAWKDSELILQNYHILVYPRPGYDAEASNLPRHTQLANAPLMEISSTFIRNAIASGKDMRHYVHRKVWQYINGNNLYRK